MRTLLLALLFYVQRGLWAALGWLINRGDRLGELIAHTGIVVFVGPNGSGKSLIAVDSMLRTLDGVTWRCVAVDHAHNAPFVEHAETCDECELRTMDRPIRCRWGRFLGMIGARSIGRHVRRCSGCESWPGQFGGRCSEGRHILNVCGRGERLAYSTVALLDEHGRPHRLFRPVDDYRQLIGIEHADVLFDEVAGISDAADSASMPAALTRWLQQLRKRDVRLRVTSPDYDRCSKPIRQVAQVVVDARAFFVEPTTGTETEGRLWRPRRAMLYKAYDGFAFQHFTAHQGETLSTLARRAFWRPGCRAQSAYDTLAHVLALGDVTETGMCMVCGGSRSRPRCSCTHEVDAAYAAGHELEVIETVSSTGARVRKALVDAGR